MRTVSAAIYDAQVTRHFLTGEELTGDELARLLERAAELKADRHASRALAGRSVALIFEKPSTRTRISFEVGINELGGHAVVLREGEMQLSRGESVRDTALVLSRYVAAIGVRTGPHAPVGGARRARERAGREHAHRRSPPVPGARRPAHAEGALRPARGAEARLRRRRQQRRPLADDHRARRWASRSPSPRRPSSRPQPVGQRGGRSRIRRRRCRARTRSTRTSGSAWATRTRRRKRELLEPYRLDEALLGRAADDAIALHCLPAHVGEEITAECPLRPAVGGVGPGGEPPARPEGPA